MVLLEVTCIWFPASGSAYKQLYLKHQGRLVSTLLGEVQVSGSSCHWKSLEKASQRKLHSNRALRMSSQVRIRENCVPSIYLFIYFYCSGFCHTLKWNSHGFTCAPHPDTPSHLPLHPIPLGLPSAPGLSACLMHPTWAGDLFHPRWYTCFDAVLLKHPTLAFSHRV